MLFPFLNLYVSQISKSKNTGTTDPTVGCSYQSNFYRSCRKFLHNSWTNFIFRISTKHQLQNLNQTSASRLNLKFKVLTKPSFRISTKIKLHNLNWVSAAKYWPNFSFKISPELRLQNLDQAFCSSSEQKVSFMTKLQLPNLHQIVVNTFHKYWVSIFLCQGHINQVY